MTKTKVAVQGQEVELITHYIDDEISEVYAVWQDQEIESAYDLDEMMSKLEQYFANC